ncbi:MAG TPA: disulfide oxidoreductase [Candidatus Kerfeldbacteria bacterium]|nr:disulfide oxidoreductase [Candidatus Kerfeldbacteria bacterium]
MEITKDSLIGEVLLEYPEAQEVMLKHFGEQVACVMCPGQAFDTFAMIAELHGIEDDVVDEMMKEMRQVINQVEKERT